MPGYTGYHADKKRGWSVTATIVVIVAHGIFIVGLYQLTQTEYVRDLIKVSKLLTMQEPVKRKEPQPPPAEEKKPQPEARLEPPPMVRESPPEPARQEPEERPVQAPLSAGKGTDQAPANNAPFAIGKGRGRFALYEDLLMGSIQAVYQQPPELPDNMSYAVLCQLIVDEDGYVLGYKLMSSSGNELFDRSAQQALSRLRQVRPPPPGMSHTITVKFFPP